MHKRFGVLSLLLMLACCGGFAASMEVPEMYYADTDHNELPATEAQRVGLIEAGKLPRGRLLWAPNKSFHICYRGGAR